MILGKLLYGALFVVVLPALLVAWTLATADIVTVPVIRSIPIGAALIAAGAALVVSGWFALWRHGGGLPMNAFPPPRYVTRGPYAIVAHPIYVGSCAVCFGASIAAGSSSGFWLASPAMVLASAALVLGFERHDLRARFGELEGRPWLSIPPADDTAPTMAERLSLYPLVLLLSAALHAIVVRAGSPPDARSTLTAFEATLPVWERTEALSALVYPLALSAPFAARTRRDLRALAVNGLFACALVSVLHLALPFTSPPRPFTPEGPLGHLLTIDRALTSPAAALPSAHAVWALLAADAWASRWPRARLAFRSLAVAVAAARFTTGVRSIADVAAGLFAYAAVVRHGAVWALLRGLAERIANSWSERRIGPLRLINHGAWGGLSLFGGIVLVGSLVGPGHTLSIFVAAGSGLVCAALWAQIIEGSPSLLRPYGFYGGVLGIVLGSLAAPLTGTSVWLLLSAYATAAPFIQSVGRLRCLVQGCCHGHEAPPSIGIRYLHPRSRVVRLSTLGGVPVHPTQLYSILWNAASALVLGRLWSLALPLHFIAGVYLVLNGLGRFVEEAYRGEPQTPVYFRLRFYQWIAIASVVVGALVTALFTTAPAPLPSPSWPTVGVATLFGAIAAFASGVDFPGSSRRFSRLV